MKKIDLHGQPLDLNLTLTCGQAFRWRKLASGVWRGVVRDSLVELLAEDGNLYWRTYPDADEMLVRDYLRLTDDVKGIYSRLSQTDAHLACLVMRFYGLRLLRQDPSETL
ncbi:MAG: DNA glycosylase, partial [Armatimonadota bacterium]